MLESLISQLQLHLSAITSYLEKEKSHYRLTLDQHDYLLIDHPSGILFQTALGIFPEERAEKMATLMMRANYLGQGTGDGVLGLTSGGDQVTFSLLLFPDITYRHFEEQLELFINYAIYWRTELEKTERSIFNS